jgi:VWFA-related protein
MRYTYLTITVILAALVVTLTGCGGGFGPTIPSPDGIPGGAIQQQFRVNVGGNAIQNANRGDFLFEEKLQAAPDGAYRQVNPVAFNFVQAQQQAAVVALVLDRSGSMSIGTRAPDLMAAARQWVQGMRPQDQTAVVIYDDQIDVVQDLTSDHALLDAAIDQATPRGLTATYDAAIAGINLLAASNIPGPKALLLMTDGQDNNSQSSIQDVINAAVAANVVIYTVGFEVPVGGAIEANMTQIAQGTNGEFINAADGAALAAAFTQIQQTVQQPYYETAWMTGLQPGEAGVMRVTYLRSNPPIVQYFNFVVPLPSE